MLRPKRLPVALVAALLLAPSLGAAQCVLEGVTRVDWLRGGEPPMPIEQRMRVTLAGATASLEGTAPLAFHAAVPAERVRLYLGPPGLSNQVMAASQGVRVFVQSATRDGVTATLRADYALAVRGVRLPCRALSTTPSPSQPATAPSHPVNRRWVSDSYVHREMRCTGRRGARGCAERVSPASRCRPVADASQCGYHPLRGSLRVFSAPSERSASVEAVPTRDVVFVDEDGRRAWLRVRSHALTGGALALNGWVRRGDVRWSQEVPPGIRRAGGVGVTRGRVMARGMRRGYVTLRADTEVRDARGELIARTAVAAFCTEGEHWPGEARVRIALPGGGAAHERALVAEDRVEWSAACPAVSP